MFRNNQMQRLIGKNTIVLGGGTGIGLGIARAFASEGANVMIGGRREEKLRQAIADCEFPIACQAVDVADRNSMQQFFAAAFQSMPRIDILVNSAGINIKTRTMSEMTPEQWDEVLQVNATGAYNAMYQVLPKMRQQGDGLIINISSVAGKRAIALGGIAYCASKFAMTALGTAVGNEDAKHGIRVTNIYPGEVETPLLDKRPQPVSAERRATMLQPADVAELAVTIASLPARAHVPELVIKPTVQEFC
jgi:NADP-dependent 3-hydroxy acid dehydrogenase YdfG